MSMHSAAADASTAAAVQPDLVMRTGAGPPLLRLLAVLQTRPQAAYPRIHHKHCIADGWALAAAFVHSIAAHNVTTACNHSKTYWEPPS
jgi:hypothetical protein